MNLQLLSEAKIKRLLPMKRSLQTMIEQSNYNALTASREPPDKLDTGHVVKNAAESTKGSNLN